MNIIALLLLTLNYSLVWPASSSAFSFNANPTQKFNIESSFVDSMDNFIGLWIYSNNLHYSERLERLDSLQKLSISHFGSRSSANAFVLHKMGVIEHLKAYDGDKQGFERAITLYRTALNIRIELNDPNIQDLSKDIINGYNMIGICYYELGDLPSSVMALKKGLNFADGYHLKDSIFNVILKLNTQAARTYSDIGDYDQALSHYKTIITYSCENRSDDEINIISNWKIRAYLESSAIYAISLYQPNLAFTILNYADSVLNYSEIEDKEFFKANLLNKQGISYHLVGENNKAIHFLKNAIAINEESDSEFELAGNYLNLALAKKEIGAFNEAEQYLEKAKSLFIKTNQEHKLARVYDNLGDLEFEKGNYRKSLEYDNLSIAYMMPEFITNSIYSNPILDSIAISDKLGMLISLSSRSESFLQLFYQETEQILVEAAYNNLSLADRVIGLMRSEFQAEASKLTLATFAKPVYERGIESCFQLYQVDAQDTFLEKAFAYLEKSRAIVLLDAVRKTRASNKVDTELIGQERALNQKVNYFEKKAALREGDPTNSELNRVYDSLEIYRRRRKAIVDQIKSESPEYHQIIFEEASASIAEVQNALEEGQSFVEYFVGDSSVYTFVINRDTTLFLKMDQPDSVRKWSNEWIAAMKVQGMTFLEPGHKLYSTLIEPVRDVLGEKLILVPDDVLNLVNFDALVTEKPQEGNVYLPDFKNYLIYDHQLSYAFSASTLMENQSSRKKRSSRFLGVAPEMGKRFNLQGEWFDKLEHNVEQIEETARLFPDHNIVKPASAKASFEKFAPDYDVIHCAAHALANNKDGDLSFILFGENETDILYAKDIYALELDADMVVLSACQTSEGELNRGEGIISLARSFTYAGASSVVTSLWSVREIVNNKIINEFYHQLKSGKSKDEALKNAKIKYLDNISINDAPNAHPYFWAPLIIIGDNDNTFRNQHSTVIMITAALLLFISIMLFLKRGR